MSVTTLDNVVELIERSLHLKTYLICADLAYLSWWIRGLKFRSICVGSIWLGDSRWPMAV